MRETPIRWLDSWVGFVRRSLARNIGEGKQARATAGRDGHSPLNKGLMMSAEFQLLPMLVGDYDEVMALWNAVQGVRANETREEFARILARNEGLCSVVRRGNELAAAVLACHDGRRGYLYHLGVAAQFRRHGLGRLLVDHSLNRLKEEGISRCTIFLLRGNEVGEAFWKRIGWRERTELTFLAIDFG